MYLDDIALRGGGVGLEMDVIEVDQRQLVLLVFGR